MARTPGGGDPFDTPQKAYAEAERRIAAAKASNATELDLQLRHLERLPQSIADITALRIVLLQNTKVADLAPLAAQTRLACLRLDGTPVVDIAPLAGLTELQILSLDGTKGVDFALLAGHTALQALSLGGTWVSDLAVLAGLTSLQSLWLGGTQVVDLAPLSGLTALRNLSLSNTRVADLVPLSGLAVLETLWLGGTQVADLAPLSRMTRMIDRVHEDPANGFITQHDRRIVGLFYAGTPIAATPPFDRLSKLDQPARTIETINEVRRQQGLPPHEPGEQPLPPEPALPKQGLAIRYVAPDDGPIDVDRGAALDGRERDKLGGMQSEMLEALRELRKFAASSNGYIDLVPTVDKYLAALDHPVDDLRDGDVEILYARGIRIQDAYEELQDQIRRGEAPEADRRLRSPMQVILSMHGPFLLSTQRGAELYAHTEHDQRTRDQELAFQKKRAELNKALRAEAPDIATPRALEENEAATASISSRRHPERGAVSGRNANRNFDIAQSDLARRWKYLGSPRRAATTVASSVGLAIVGKAAAATNLGVAVTATTTAAMETALTGGAAISLQAADFMVRHAQQYRELANLGGASYAWLRTYVDWLVATMKRVRIVIDDAEK